MSYSNGLWDHLEPGAMYFVESHKYSFFKIDTIDIVGKNWGGYYVASPRTIMTLPTSHKTTSYINGS